jgi:DNA-binding XRE family transcriptional regulator
MSKFDPHQQLKAIRAALGKTQMELAQMLDVSYPYLLSIETGQRDMSDPLARRITWLFGLTSKIHNKRARSMTWDPVARTEVPFTALTFEKHKVQLPMFSIPQIPDQATPTVLTGYAKAFHALLDSAKTTGRLTPVLSKFFELLAENTPSEHEIKAFRASYRKLYPKGSHEDEEGALLRYICDLQRLSSQPRKAQMKPRGTATQL